MKTLLFHTKSGNYEFKGFGDLDDAIDRCGENITYDEESEKDYYEIKRREFLNGLKFNF